MHLLYFKQNQRRKSSTVIPHALVSLLAPRFFSNSSFTSLIHVGYHLLQIISFIYIYIFADASIWDNQNHWYHKTFVVETLRGLFTGLFTNTNNNYGFSFTWNQKDTVCLKTNFFKSCGCAILRLFLLRLNQFKINCLLLEEGMGY